jgi:hypothetical protein
MTNVDQQQRFDPDAAFERDVPEDIRDDLYQAMAEATASGESRGDVSICEHDRIDAINCTASGFVRVGDREYAFEMEDGNSRGTVLLHWGPDERPFERHEPIRYAVQPSREAIALSVEAGRVPLLLAKWTAIAAQPQVAEILRGYGYDRYFAPGHVTETHWRDRAARMGLVIVDQETAAETRRSLTA